MDVLLVHNPSAGADDVGGSDLTAQVRRAGHRVVHVPTDDPGWRDVVHRPSDLVAVAGGDGTLRKVLTELAGTGATVGVIPTGTANNIARTLGIPVDDTGSAVALWDAGSPCTFSLPVARCGSDERRFVESVGGGTFSHLLATAERRQRRRGADADTRGGLQMLRDVLADGVAGGWTVEVDGLDRSGEYLAVEALNIRSVGPNVLLAPDADPADALLDVVLVAAGDRGALVAHVDELVTVAETDRREAEPPRLTVRRGRRVRLLPPPGEQLHLDDAALPHSCREVTIDVDRTGVSVLVPNR